MSVKSTVKVINKVVNEDYKYHKNVSVLQISISIVCVCLVHVQAANRVLNESKINMFMCLTTSVNKVLQQISQKCKFMFLTGVPKKHPAAACRSRRGCTWGGAARAAPPTMLLIG